MHPQAGAPLHVCRLLRGSLQPPLLHPVPGVDLGGRGVLHLPQHRLRVSGGGARLAPRPHEVRVPAADPDVGGGHLLGPGTGVTLQPEYSECTLVVMLITVTQQAAAGHKLCRTCECKIGSCINRYGYIGVLIFQICEQ